ncbi:hypothetical protein SAMN06265337_0620 [Hymenobacter gelipurpurascens]|uniref:Uncharacterized protein n=1 Tax=Hymenobacter gelipurpurascens TaxID=89968 RepID=A0A212T8P8_9BACT|nr:hypothetical protein SAMN06265337_0620 [Hymenobacter gelipurpurascens]
MLLAALPPADKLYTALAGVAVAVALLLLDMLRTTLNEWREARRKKKQSNFFYLAEKQVLLDQATERICLTTKADHVGLYRLHNGEYFEGDDSIKKMSQVSEAVGGRDISRWKLASQSMLMSNYPHLVLGLKQAAYYWMHPDNVQDFEMGRLMNDRAYDSCVALLICGKKNRPLAILILSWCRDHVTEADVDLLSLESDRRDLAFTLSD